MCSCRLSNTPPSPIPDPPATLIPAREKATPLGYNTMYFGRDAATPTSHPNHQMSALRADRIFGTWFQGSESQRLPNAIDAVAPHFTTPCRPNKQHRLVNVSQANSRVERVVGL